MNVQETKQCMEIMQAYVDGEVIQMKCDDGTWMERSRPRWNFDMCEYRVKKNKSYRIKNASEIIKGLEDRGCRVHDYGWGEFAYPEHNKENSKYHITLDFLIENCGREAHKLIDGTFMVENINENNTIISTEIDFIVETYYE